MTQILQNSAAEMKDNDCFMVTSTEPGLQVSDFLMSYFSLFSQRDHDHFSGVTECDLIAPNVCALYFGVRNVEGEKGVTNSLRFEINPDTKSIKPDTFECFGVS